MGNMGNAPAPASAGPGRVKPGWPQTIQELPARTKPRRRPAWSTEMGIELPAPGSSGKQAAGAAPSAAPRIPIHPEQSVQPLRKLLALRQAIPHDFLRQVVFIAVDVEFAGD